MQKNGFLLPAPPQLSRHFSLRSRLYGQKRRGLFLAVNPLLTLGISIIFPFLMTRKPLLLAALLLLAASPLLLSGVSARRARVGVNADRSPSSIASSSSSSLPPLAPRLFTSFHGQAPVSKEQRSGSFAAAFRSRLDALERRLHARA